MALAPYRVHRGFNVGMSEIRRAAEALGKAFKDVLKGERDAESALRLAIWDFAYQRGLKDGRSGNTSRASNGRRLIGATTRQRAELASQEYRHLSKDKAAPIVADLIGKSPSLVRRYLSQITNWTR